MPSLQQSSQTAKRQQSISSFFKAPSAGTKSAASKPRPLPTLNRAQENQRDEGSGDESLFLPDNFAKRAGPTAEDEDGEEDSIPSNGRHKRRRLSDSHQGHGNASDLLLQPNLSSRTLHLTNANGAKKPGSPSKTSKYLFSSSASIQEPDDAADDEETRRSKEKLHQRFVKKLGRPDSIAEIKRRNWQVAEVPEYGETQDGVDLEEEQDHEERTGSAARKRKRKDSGSKRTGSKLTPLEKQVVEIKTKHPDTILVVEVGYKFRFFGEDARTASKELSIVCIPGKFRFDNHPSEAHIERFASASIPVHRLHVHVKRLVSAGHKVGIVRQLETAALKAAGDNRNAPFERKLTNLYTKGTYVDDVEGLEVAGKENSDRTHTTGYLLCVTESKSKGWGSDEKVRIGFIAVQPATGDVVYDDFEDGFMRSEIETRLLHIAPCEFLIVGELSKPTDKLIRHLSSTKSNVFADSARVERIEKTKNMAAQAYTHVSNFYAGKMNSSSQENDATASTLLEKILTLSENTTICLSAMITHLSEYRLEHVLDLTKYFQPFSARSHMLLNGTTLTSLEIYQNQTDYSTKGSLFWTLDRTRTRFGQRLLRKWVGRPLLDRSRLEERIAAVEELQEGSHVRSVDKVRDMLSAIKNDLEKSLIRIYYGKCTRPELLSVLQTMQRIATEFATVKSPKDAGFHSSMISKALATLPLILDDVIHYLEKINAQAAKDDDKYAFFRESEETEDIGEHKLGIASVEHELDEHLAVAGEKVKNRNISYVTSAGIEYLIEIKNTQLKNVPASWAKISGTKTISRFHTPEVIRLIRERDQHKESLAAACDAAFASLLGDISTKYQSFRDCVSALGTLDCLLSLASVASQPGYVKPEYTSETCVVVQRGRHPMVEQLLLDAYVPNDIDLETEKTRALLVTGPNMGGKSSYVRQVALIAIMGQIGSYVPAEHARLGMLDAVFTRMGAFDNMMAGESTFMVELSETSDILKQASSRSLVILDELGRGTSTHDGVAIAQAVLNHLVQETRCLTLFITHYQNLSSLAKVYKDKELRNVHMTFAESENGDQNITFLYEVGEGVAHRSYGYVHFCRV